MRRGIYALFHLFPNENVFCGAQKNRLDETVLLSSHKIHFPRQIR